MKAQNQLLIGLMAKAGISRKQLATTAGVRPETIWRISIGRCKPTAEVAEAIASALGADPCDLFHEIAPRGGVTLRQRQQMLKMNDKEIAEMEANNRENLIKIKIKQLKQQLAEIRGAQ